MTKFYSVNDAANYAYFCISPKLQEKYDVTLLGYIIDGMLEYMENIESFENEEPNFENMLAYIVDDFGALDDFDAELTLDDLMAICAAEEQYVDTLDEYENEEDE